MATSSTDSCVSCGQPLVLLIEDEDETSMSGIGVGPSGGGEYVDDDVHLRCGCHFHWQCLLDAYTIQECPNCHRILLQPSATGDDQLLCNLKNEGGLQQDLDILPILTEELYLKAYPEERKCQAFLGFCGEGDLEAIVDLLQDEEEEDIDGEQGSSELVSEILRYQDQIRTMNSGLHVAIQNQRVEVAWLLLLLASKLDISQFPPDVLSAAEQSGLARDDQSGKADIRALRDAEGMLAEERAASMGGIWTDWVRTGRLKIP